MPLANTPRITKSCTRCNQVKTLDCFGVDKTKKIGRTSRCNECEKVCRREKYLRRKETMNAATKKWYQENREYQREYVKFKKGQNPNFQPKGKHNNGLTHEQTLKITMEKNAVQCKKRDKIQKRIWKKAWDDNNREHINNYVKDREATDLNFKLGRRLRARIKYALKAQGTKKSHKTLDLLGCSFAFFRQWIERNFENGMTWDNYGNGIGKWVLDHDMPCARFDLTDPIQQKKCFGWQNIFPRWCHHNLAKSDNLWVFDYEI